MKIRFENENERKALVDVLASNLGCPKQYGNLFTGYSCKNLTCANCWDRLLVNISEVEAAESATEQKEEQLSLDKLYDAVCKEATLYEEHDTLKEEAEHLKSDIFENVEHTYGMLLDCIKYHTMQALKALHTNWKTLSWADYSDEDHIEYLHDEVAKMLAVAEKEMYQSEEMKAVLCDAVNATEGIYAVLLSYVLEECESEQDYYELLVFMQNHWEDISWKQNDSITQKDNAKKPEDEVIRHFTGKYAFLSNAYEEEFMHHGISYRNAEAAYQASKTEYDTIKNLFSKLNAHDAKKLGKQLTIRDKWDSKVEMYEVIWDKFYQSPKLRVMLMETKDAVLTPEGIGTFWGMKDGNGENHLGKILMDVRDNLFAIESEKDGFDKEVDEAIRTEKESMEKASVPKHQTPIYDFFKAISDYEKGVVNVEHMTNAITNLAKNLIDNERALLMADLAELLEHSDNVPKALYTLMKEYKEKDLHFKD